MIHRNAANAINVADGKSNWRLGVVRNLVPAPSSSVHSKFVEKGRGESVVPDDGERFVDLIVMENVVGAISVKVVS
jgi:glutamate-1-semialdehyde aminotransferase